MPSAAWSIHSNLQSDNQISFYDDDNDDNSKNNNNNNNNSKNKNNNNNNNNKINNINGSNNNNNDENNVMKTKNAFNLNILQSVTDHQDEHNITSSQSNKTENIARNPGVSSMNNSLTNQNAGSHIVIMDDSGQPLDKSGTCVEMYSVNFRNSIYTYC